MAASRLEEILQVAVPRTCQPRHARLQAQVYLPQKIQRPADRVPYHVRHQAAVQSANIALMADNVAEDVKRVSPSRRMRLVDCRAVNYGRGRGGRRTHAAGASSRHRTDGRQGLQSARRKSRRQIRRSKARAWARRSCRLSEDRLWAWYANESDLHAVGAAGAGEREVLSRAWVHSGSAG